MYIHNAGPITKPGSSWYWVEGGFWMLICAFLGTLFLWLGAHPLNTGGLMIGVVLWLMVPLFFGCWYLDWKGYKERMAAPVKAKHLFKRKPKDKMTLSEIIQECQRAENKKRYLERRNAARSKVPTVASPTPTIIRSEELIE